MLGVICGLNLGSASGLILNFCPTTAEDHFLSMEQVYHICRRLSITIKWFYQYPCRKTIISAFQNLRLSPAVKQKYFKFCLL